MESRLSNINDDVFVGQSRRVSMERTDTIAFSEAPTAVPSPKISRTVSLDKDEKTTNQVSGVPFTATNTIDTLAVDGPEVQKTEEQSLANASTVRKLALLSMFTLAEFLDAFNNSALFPAIPIVSEELKFETTETVWIISAYQLTFAAFLLVVSSLFHFSIGLI